MATKIQKTIVIEGKETTIYQREVASETAALINEILDLQTTAGVMTETNIWEVGFAVLTHIDEPDLLAIHRQIKTDPNYPQRVRELYKQARVRLGMETK